MVNVTPISGRELDVDWSPPTNGIVDYYTLYLTSDHAHQINVSEKVFISYYRFTSLHPGETYTVHIRSHVANVMSSEVTMSAMTCKYSPPPPPPKFFNFKKKKKNILKKKKKNIFFI